MLGAEFAGGEEKARGEAAVRECQCKGGGAGGRGEEKEEGRKSDDGVALEVEGKEEGKEEEEEGCGSSEGQLLGKGMME